MSRIPPGPLTDALLALTALAWVIVALAGWDNAAAYVAGFIPARIAGELAVAGALPAWLTPLSSAFVHAGFMHLALNGIMLLYCGRFVELALGRVRTAALYLIGAYVSAATQYLVDPSSVVPVVGASGAISALVGAYALLFTRQRVKARFGIPPVVVHVVWLAIAWTLLQVAVGYAFGTADTGIAIWSHIGGFIVGLALAIPMLKGRRRRIEAPAP